MISTTRISTSVNPGRAGLGRAMHPSWPPIRATSKTAGRPVSSRPAVKFTATPLQVPWHDTVRATPDRAHLARQPLRIEGQGAQELRRAARLRNVLEPRGELDQGRLAEGRAHEADAYGQTEGRAHRHVDDGVAHDRRRSRAADGEVVAIDQVRRPGRVVGRGDDRMEVVLREQQVDAFRGAEQLIGGYRVVVRDPERLYRRLAGNVERLRELEDLLPEEL